MGHRIQRNGFTWEYLTTLVYRNDRPNLELLENLRKQFPEFYIMRTTNIYSEEALIKFGVYRRV